MNPTEVSHARTLACVRACEGIDDPSLLPLVLNSLEVRAEKADHRMEELIKTLETVQSHLFEKPLVNTGDRLILQLIHATINKAKGIHDGPTD